MCNFLYLIISKRIEFFLLLLIIMFCFFSAYARIKIKHCKRRKICCGKLVNKQFNMMKTQTYICCFSFNYSVKLIWWIDYDYLFYCRIETCLLFTRICVLLTVKTLTAFGQFIKEQARHERPCLPSSGSRTIKKSNFQDDISSFSVKVLKWSKFNNKKKRTKNYFEHKMLFSSV